MTDASYKVKFSIFFDGCEQLRGIFYHCDIATRQAILKLSEGIGLGSRHGRVSFSQIINNSWTSKRSRIVSDEQMNYFPKPKTEANN